MTVTNVIPGSREYTAIMLEQAMDDRGAAGGKDRADDRRSWGVGRAGNNQERIASDAQEGATSDSRSPRERQ
jgi:hypothetical protein